MNISDVLYNTLEREPLPLLTFEELRNRLKHIATLCVGLSIDLANEIKERETLQEDLEYLKKECGIIDGDLNYSVEERRLKQKQLWRKYYRKKCEKRNKAEKANE